MALSFGILLALVAVFCWGIADFIVASALKKKDVFSILFWTQLLGFLFFSLLAFFSGTFFIPRWELLFFLLVTGLLSALAYVFLYRALKEGQVSVAMPVYSCWALVTMLLSIVFLGERLNALQAFGAILAIAGAVLASFKLSEFLKQSEKKFETGVKFAFLAMLGFGIFFAFFDFLVSKIGWLLTIVFLTGMRLFSLFFYSAAGKNRIVFPSGAVFALLAVGLLEFFATSAYSIGISTEFSAIVAPVASISPIITIILARIFFKEKSELNQKIGIVLVFVGLLLLSIA